MDVHAERGINEDMAHPSCLLCAYSLSITPHSVPPSLPHGQHSQSTHVGFNMQGVNLHANDSTGVRGT